MKLDKTIVFAFRDAAVNGDINRVTEIAGNPKALDIIANQIDEAMKARSERWHKISSRLLEIHFQERERGAPRVEQDDSSVESIKAGESDQERAVVEIIAATFKNTDVAAVIRKNAKPDTLLSIIGDVRAIELHTIKIMGKFAEYSAHLLRIDQNDGAPEPEQVDVPIEGHALDLVNFCGTDAGLKKLISERALPKGRIAKMYDPFKIDTDDFKNKPSHQRCSPAAVAHHRALEARR